MPNYYSEKPYEGKEAIVVAMDIGTTNSERGLSSRGEASLIHSSGAVSFVHLSPGDQPQGKMVW
jgi:hypothetical protein